MQLHDSTVVQEERVQRRHRSSTVAEIFEERSGPGQIASGQEGEAFVVIAKQSADPAPTRSEAHEHRCVQRKHSTPDDSGAEGAQGQEEGTEHPQARGERQWQPTTVPLPPGDREVLRLRGQQCPIDLDDRPRGPSHDDLDSVVMFGPNLNK
jgi:hypothetical protein